MQNFFSNTFSALIGFGLAAILAVYVTKDDIKQVITAGITAGVKGGPISEGEADHLLQGYVTDHGGLMAKINKNFMGTFLKEDLYVDKETNVGVKLWFCRNKADVDHEFFVAAERVSQYAWPTVNDLPKGPVVRPENVLPYKGPTTNIKDGDMMDYLATATWDTPALSVPISPGDVPTYIHDFNSVLGTYAKYPFAFFIFDKDFTDKLCRSEVKYIRYYFGFDSRDKPNALRVILIAADAYGNNLIDGNLGYVIMQKSIPPPPGN